ncbi:MAG TPA: hypothetical protein PKI62_01650 [bacterium]|nr:hypothetical protein [bacterium]HPR86679.1 hypothetical protein [bacterium]
MNQETEPILYYWLQSANSMRVRRIRRVEGRQRLQINLENAVYYRLLWSGRPDGMSAKGFGSYLLFHQEEARTLFKQGKRKQLCEQEQRHLEEELLSYFPRALAFLKLGEYQACAQDLHHCMELVRFSYRYGRGTAAAESTLEMMPTLHMTYYFALCAMSLQEAQIRRAVYYLDRGAQRIAADYLRIPLRSAGGPSEEALRLSSFKAILLRENVRRRRKEGKNTTALPRKRSPHVPICMLLSQQRRPSIES